MPYTRIQEFKLPEGINSAEKPTQENAIDFVRALLEHNGFRYEENFYDAINAETIAGKTHQTIAESCTPLFNQNKEQIKTVLENLGVKESQREDLADQLLQQNPPLEIEEENTSPPSSDESEKSGETSGESSSEEEENEEDDEKHPFYLEIQEIREQLNTLLKETNAQPNISQEDQTKNALEAQNRLNNLQRVTQTRNPEHQLPEVLETDENGNPRLAQRKQQFATTIAKYCLDPVTVEERYFKEAAINLGFIGRSINTQGLHTFTAEITKNANSSPMPQPQEPQQQALHPIIAAIKSRIDEHLIPQYHKASLSLQQRDPNRYTNMHSRHLLPVQLRFDELKKLTAQLPYSDLDANNMQAINIIAEWCVAPQNIKANNGYQGVVDAVTTLGFVPQNTSDLEAVHDFLESIEIAPETLNVRNPLPLLEGFSRHLISQTYRQQIQSLPLASRNEASRRLQHFQEMLFFCNSYQEREAAEQYLLNLVAAADQSSANTTMSQLYQGVISYCCDPQDNADRMIGIAQQFGLIPAGQNPAGFLTHIDSQQPPRETEQFLSIYSDDVRQKLGATTTHLSAAEQTAALARYDSLANQLIDNPDPAAKCYIKLQIEILSQNDRSSLANCITNYCINPTNNTARQNLITAATHLGIIQKNDAQSEQNFFNAINPPQPTVSDDDYLQSYVTNLRAGLQRDISTRPQAEQNTALGIFNRFAAKLTDEANPSHKTHFRTQIERLNTTGQPNFANAIKNYCTDPTTSNATGMENVGRYLGFFSDTDPDSALKDAFFNAINPPVVPPAPAPAPTPPASPLSADARIMAIDARIQTHLADPATTDLEAQEITARLNNLRLIAELHRQPQGFTPVAADIQTIAGYCIDPSTVNEDDLIDAAETLHLIAANPSQQQQKKFCNQLNALPGTLIQERLDREFAKFSSQLTHAKTVTNTAAIKLSNLEDELKQANEQLEKHTDDLDVHQNKEKDLLAKQASLQRDIDHLKDKCDSLFDSDLLEITRDEVRELAEDQLLKRVETKLHDHEIVATGADDGQIPRLRSALKTHTTQKNRAKTVFVATDALLIAHDATRPVTRAEGQTDNDHKHALDQHDKERKEYEATKKAKKEEYEKHEKNEKSISDEIDKKIAEYKKHYTEYREKAHEIDILKIEIKSLQDNKDVVSAAKTQSTEKTKQIRTDIRQAKKELQQAEIALDTLTTIPSPKLAENQFSHIRDMTESSHQRVDGLFSEALALAPHSATVGQSLYKRKEETIETFEKLRKQHQDFLHECDRRRREITLSNTSEKEKARKLSKLNSDMQASAILLDKINVRLEDAAKLKRHSKPQKVAFFKAANPQLEATAYPKPNPAPASAAPTANYQNDVATAVADIQTFLASAPSSSTIPQPHALATTDASLAATQTMVATDVAVIQSEINPGSTTTYRQATLQKYDAANDRFTQELHLSQAATAKDPTTGVPLGIGAIPNQPGRDPIPGEQVIEAALQFVSNFEVRTTKRPVLLYFSNIPTNYADAIALCFKAKNIPIIYGAGSYKPEITSKQVARCERYLCAKQPSSLLLNTKDRANIELPAAEEKSSWFKWVR